MLNRRIIESQVSVHEQWALVEWCRARGADEFSFEAIFVQIFDETGAEIPTGDPSWDEYIAPIAHFGRPRANREQPSLFRSQPRRTDVALWELAPASLTWLRAIFDRGPLASYDHEQAGVLWPDNLVLYRQGEIMLAFLSREGEALLRLEAAEFPSFQQLGIRHHDVE